MIRLFEIEGKVVKPTEHCHMINWLSVIMDNHPDDYMKIYAFIYYMSCPAQENPYFNIPDEDKEDLIIADLGIDFSLEHDDIQEALEKAEKLYETVSLRAYKAISKMLENLNQYLEHTEITAGRDGNINSLLRVAEKFDPIRKSFKGVLKDLESEQQINVRGSQDLGYDQIT